jgi:hypothetical protein
MENDIFFSHLYGELENKLLVDATNDSILMHQSHLGMDLCPLSLPY